MRIKLVLLAASLLVMPRTANAASPALNIYALAQCDGGATPGVQCPGTSIGPLNPLWVQLAIAGGQTPATAQKQDTGNNILNAMSINQANVQSAPGTPAPSAITIQGAPGGAAVTVSGAVTVIVPATATQTTNIITTVAVTATSGTVTASNSGRKSLQIMNTGSNSCTLTTVTPAVSGAGIVLATGGSFPAQGGSVQYDAKVPTNAYYAICPTGLSTTFAVEEGN